MSSHPRHTHRTRIALLLLIATLLLSGCVGKGGTPSTPSDTQTRDKVDGIVTSFNQADPDSFNRVEEIVDIGEPAIPVLLEMLDDKDLSKRWAAIYALSRIVYDVDEERRREVLPSIRDAFNDPNPTIRQTAAGTAVAIGDKDGIPILIEYLRSDDSRLLAGERVSLSSYSIQVLRHYTHQDFGYDLQKSMGEREDSIKQWESWWDQNRDTLVWDLSIGEYGGYRT